MVFISFAQHGEDVKLHRALEGVDRGFYIDVGAQDPVHNSVTKAFYDRGWRGINVEPSSEYFVRLRDERPRDENVNAVASGSRGEVRFFEIPGTGLSTMSAEIKSVHEQRGYRVIDRTVPSVRLDDLCEQFCAGDIHFLKIDTEGSERLVLEGISLDRFRPWIILIEATRPLSDVETHQEWEPMLLAADYAFAHADGINRFYVANERATVAAALRAADTGERYVRYSRRRLRFAVRLCKYALAEVLQRVKPASRSGDRSPAESGRDPR